MAEIKKELRNKITNHNITVDDKTGIAKVEVTLAPRRGDEYTVKIITNTAKALVEESGLEVEQIITACTINNRRGAASGLWEFKVKQAQKKAPAKTPAKKKTTPKKQTVVEEPAKEEASGFFKNRNKKKGAE